MSCDGLSPAGRKRLSHRLRANYFLEKTDGFHRKNAVASVQGGAARRRIAQERNNLPLRPLWWRPAPRNASLELVARQGVSSAYGALLHPICCA
jgi:hypothetical protein